MRKDTAKKRRKCINLLPNFKKERIISALKKHIGQLNIKKEGDMKKFVDFSKMVGEMIVKPLPEALHIAATKGAKVVGSSRCCIILPVQKNRLVLYAGYPEKGHAVGQEVAGEHADFLKTVMYKHRYTLHIHNPAHDPRTPHLKEHATHHDITSIVFTPLLREEEPLGIMVFDFSVSDITSVEAARTAEIVGDFVAHVITHTHRNTQEKEGAPQKKLVELLGQRYSQIADIMRNFFMSAGARARTLKDDASLAATSRKNALVIFEEIMKLERIIKNVLDYEQFDPAHLACERHNLETFLRGFLEKEQSSHSGVHLHPLQLNHNITLCFDEEKMKVCLHNIVRHATEAGAKNVWMKMKVHARKKRVLISIASDGKVINKKDLAGIFDPFFSIKASGTGLDLSIAEAIVNGHGGIITAESKTKKRCVKNECNERTIFKIHLPL